LNEDAAGDQSLYRCLVFQPGDEVDMAGTSRCVIFAQLCPIQGPYDLLRLQGHRPSDRIMIHWTLSEGAPFEIVVLIITYALSVFRPRKGNIFGKFRRTMAVRWRSAQHSTLVLPITSFSPLPLLVRLINHDRHKRL
jgi:hypothetical protein